MKPIQMLIRIRYVTILLTRPLFINQYKTIVYLDQIFLFICCCFDHLLNVLQILYKDLVDHEAEIKDLLRQCDSTLESIPPSKEKQDLQDKAEEIRAEFDELKLCALERDQKLEASMRHAQCFQDMLDKQLLWLQFSQDKLEGFQPTELQRDVIAKKLSDAQVCRSNI